MPGITNDIVCHFRQADNIGNVQMPAGYPLLGFFAYSFCGYLD